MRGGDDMFFHRRTSQKSAAELELDEMRELIGEIRQELREMKAVVDGLYFKAQISHSLLVVRKVDEEKLKALDQLLD